MFKNLFPASKQAPVEKRKVIVVSGLPRSGTSMMMKIFAAGGLPIITDNERQADEDNPNGYFEIELSKGLKDGEINWIYDAQGKAVKVISYLLEYLPDDLSYDVLFMERNITEVLTSQKKMLIRRNEHLPVSDDEMALQFQRHIKAVKYWIARQPNMRVFYVNYGKMVEEPEALCSSIADFVAFPLNVQAMLEIPRPSLYRNRA